LALYKVLRSQYADQPDISDLAVELCADMRSTLDSRHRYLVLLGHWTEQLQATLMDKLWAERSPSKWRHPSKYGMVKQLIVGTGEIGTRAFQDIWLMRRQACTQLDAYMATPTADILEHERAHITRLTHAVQPSKYAYAIAIDKSRTNNTEPVLRDPECCILTYRLLQRDPSTGGKRHTSATSQIAGVNESQLQHQN
jgi:hypothetical protein